MTRTGRSIAFPEFRLPSNQMPSKGSRLGPYARGVAHSGIVFLAVLLLSRQFGGARRKGEFGETPLVCSMRSAAFARGCHLHMYGWKAPCLLGTALYQPRSIFFWSPRLGRTKASHTTYLDWCHVKDLLFMITNLIMESCGLGPVSSSRHTARAHAVNFGFLASNAQAGPALEIHSVDLYPGHNGGPGYDPVLVSYSYFEKDPIQRANFEFFIAVRPPNSTLH